ncbi:MAG: ChrR family anti-sigma-E factor [Paracoccaceae bacterium]
MSEIHHHIPERLLAAYASGALPHPFSLVVASHVSLCPECRARLGAHEHVGGAVLEDVEAAPVSDALKDSILAKLDLPDAAPAPQGRMGVYPGPVATALRGHPPKWRSLGLGTKQSILHSGPEGSVRLLYIPPGQAVPDHGHNGMELTLVLQGSFEDDEGRFGVGDVEVADEELEHTPVAGPGAPCICLAATDAPLKFNSFLPRVLQPLFGI